MQDMMRSEWQISDVSSLYAMTFIILNPTPGWRLSLDGEEVEASVSFLMVDHFRKENITVSRYVKIEAGLFMSSYRRTAFWTAAVGIVKQSLEFPAIYFQLLLL